MYPRIRPGATEQAPNYESLETEQGLAVFGVAVPFISIFVLYMWYGEVERMMRCGEYLKALERRLNAMYPLPMVSWEQWIRERGRQLDFFYKIVVGGLLSISLASPLLAMMIVGQGAGWLSKVSVGVFSLFFLGTGFAAWDVNRRRKTIASRYGMSPEAEEKMNRYELELTQERAARFMKVDSLDAVQLSRKGS